MPATVNTSLRRFQAGLPEVVTLCLYAGLLVWAIPHHEPWADEAQAWQIARSLSPLQIFRLLPYEGHPSLWYAVLWLLNQLHVTYRGMHWVAGGIAFFGVTLLVIASPFPRWLKLLLPFTFYLSFQFAVVARSYVMAPLLMFVCAILWPKRLEKPIVLAVWLGILANVSPHTAVISGGFAIVYLIDLWRARQKGATHAPVGHVVAGCVVLLMLYGLSIAAAHPAKDASGAAIQFRAGDTQEAWIDFQQSQLPPYYPAPEPLNHKSVAWLYWKLESRLSGALTEGLVRPFWLGCCFWLFLTWKLVRTGKLHYLLPALLLVILCHRYAFFWHSGLMLPCVLTILWITWPEASFRQMRLYEQLPLLTLLLMTAIQIGWAEYAFRFDRSHDYGSGTATAAFLKPLVLQHARIVEIGNDFLSIGVQPYYDQNVFANQPAAYYWWSTKNQAKQRYLESLPQKPDVVVLEWRFHEYPRPNDIAALPLAQQLDRLGYRNTQQFCGGLPGPGRAILEWDCDLIYQIR